MWPILEISVFIESIFPRMCSLSQAFAQNQPLPFLLTKSLTANRRNKPKKLNKRAKRKEMHETVAQKQITKRQQKKRRNKINHYCKFLMDCCWKPWWFGTVLIIGTTNYFKWPFCWFILTTRSIFLGTDIPIIISKRENAVDENLSSKLTVHTLPFSTNNFLSIYGKIRPTVPTIRIQE